MDVLADHDLIAAIAQDGAAREAFAASGAAADPGEP